MNKILRYITAFGSAFLISLAGVVWNTIAPNGVLTAVFGVLAALPILLLVANLLAAKLDDQYF